MARLALVVPLALALSAVCAHAGDPLTSPQCREALDALRAHEEALPAARGDGAEPSAERRAALIRLAALRRKAASVCLRAPDDAAAPPERFSPPVAVPPVAGVPPPRVSVDRPAPAPRHPAPPLTVMSCDAAGCWASDGTRLQRAGPGLLGPRGFCTQAGNLLQCP